MPVVGFIFAIVSVIMGGIAIWIALKSDKQLGAIADLHYDEKLAMMAFYHDTVFTGQDPPLKRIKNDFSAVSHLRKYANIDKKNELIKAYLIPIFDHVINKSTLELNKSDEYDIYDTIEIALKFNIERGKLIELQKSLHYPFIKK